MQNIQKSLHGMKIAILASDGFEQSELMKPRQALDEAGAQTVILSPSKEKSKVGTGKTGAKRSKLMSRSTPPILQTSTLSIFPAES
jgi:putative intracellular protease/amidase